MHPAAEKNGNAERVMEKGAKKTTAEAVVLDQFKSSPKVGHSCPTIGYGNRSIMDTTGVSDSRL